ncbi:MAG: hypothetical protein P8Y67_12890, partial [Alphaproteobacteria bacterium]
RTMAGIGQRFDWLNVRLVRTPDVVKESKINALGRVPPPEQRKERRFNSQLPPFVMYIHGIFY